MTQKYTDEQILDEARLIIDYDYSYVEVAKALKRPKSTVAYHMDKMLSAIDFSVYTNVMNVVREHPSRYQIKNDRYITHELSIDHLIKLRDRTRRNLDKARICSSNESEIKNLEYKLKLYNHMLKIMQVHKNRNKRAI